MTDRTNIIFSIFSQIFFKCHTKFFLCWVNIFWNQFFYYCPICDLQKTIKKNNRWCTSTVLNSNKNILTTFQNLSESSSIATNFLIPFKISCCRSSRRRHILYRKFILSLTRDKENLNLEAVTGLQLFSEASISLGSGESEISIIGSSIKLI